jgi:DNA-binding MarR family transcriptional regulator
MATVTPHSASSAHSDSASALLEVVGPLRRVLRRSARRALPDDTLPQAQMELLGFLDRQPGARVQEAAAGLQLAANSVSTLVNQLVGLGFLRRERDPLDGRAVCLWITPNAARMLSARRAFRRHAVAEALSAMTPADRRRIEDAIPALRRLVARLEAEA